MEKVCLVIGAGAGIGGTVAKRFAKEGYYSYLARRTDEDGLNNLIKEISDSGGKASGSLLNVIDENSIEDLILKIETDIGPIDTVIYNIGAQIGDRALAETSYKAFEMGWRMATFGLFRLAQAVTPKMKERQGGNIIVTSATSAVRGNKGQHSHAAAMGGRRMLCQSLNAEFSKDGIHVAHVIIYQIILSNTVSGLHLPLSFVSVVAISSKNLRSFTLPESLNSFNCTSGLRKVFCILNDSS